MLKNKYIAFYAPIKPPDHPIPSGDRLIAQNLVKAFKILGANIELASGHNAKKGPRYRLKLSKLIDRRNKKLSSILLRTKDRGFTAWFNTHAYFPQTHDVARGKN